MSILKLIAAMRRRQAAERTAIQAAAPLPCDDPTPDEPTMHQLFAVPDVAGIVASDLPDEDVAELLAEVNRVQQDPLLDVPLQRGPGERGGMPFGIAVYPLTDKPLPEFDPEQCCCAATSNPPCAYCERGEYQPW